MQKLIGTALLIGLLSGCIVHTHRSRPGHSARRSSASCPPAYHWNGYQCVHNGRARGHRK